MSVDSAGSKVERAAFEPPIQLEKMLHNAIDVESASCQNPAESEAAQLAIVAGCACFVDRDVCLGREMTGSQPPLG